jgi:hypothetical protein
MLADLYLESGSAEIENGLSSMMSSLADALEAEENWAWARAARKTVAKETRE